jgi:DNA-binding XRE family transcriptional regulator
MSTNKRTTTDGVGILYRRYIQGRPEMERLLEEQRANDEIARKIYDLRTHAGITQRQLAKKIGTTASVISRLEDADYEGHSLAMLNRIAAAFNKRVSLEFVPISKKRKSA